MGNNTITPGSIGIDRLVRVLGLPSHKQTAAMGFAVTEKIYRKMVYFIGRTFFSAVGLCLEPGKEFKNFTVFPAPDMDWHRCAFWMGHLVNLAADEEIMAGPEQFLAPNGYKGQRRVYEDYRQAVLDNLDLLPAGTRSFGLRSPGEALLIALAKVHEKAAKNSDAA